MKVEAHPNRDEFTHQCEHDFDRHEHGPRASKCADCQCTVKRRKAFKLVDEAESR